MEIKRNITLDYFKLVLSFLVILIHSYPLFSSFPMLSTLSWLISNGIARIAVPCFFLINGFFLFNNNITKKYIFKCIKRLLLMYIIWILVYSYSICLNMETLYIVCKQIFLGYSHLWYILSYAEALLLFFILKKLKVSDFLLVTISIILYIIGYFIQRYYLTSDPLYAYISNTFSRNALFFALPFISLGFLIAKFKEKILLIKERYLLLMIVILLSSLLIESYSSSLINLGMDFLLSVLIFAPVLFIYILKKSKYSEIEGGAIISHIATCVYLIHIFCIALIKSFASEQNAFFIAISVFFLSILLSYSIIKVNEKIRVFF